MEFENTFEVPLPPDQAWAVLLDIPNMVRCMPGAELVEIVDDKTFKGKVTVRLGPVTMNFAGTVNFTEMDPANHRAVANARGNDAKGRGTASAVVKFGLISSAHGSLVSIRTSLSLTGSVAQYGRASGVIKELANQITAEFAQRLRSQIEKEKAAVAEDAVALTAPGEASTYSTPGEVAAPSAPSIPSTPPPPMEHGLSAGRLIWKVILAYLMRMLGRQQG